MKQDRDNAAIRGKTRAFRLLALTTLLLGSYGLDLAPALAGAPPGPTPAASPCDPQYSRSLSARAWLEAQREITQNQNLIYKPDSVLEYTCFNRYLNVLGQQAQSMFSESTRWGAGLGATHMDNALQNLVEAAVVSYINSNFENVNGGAGGATYDLLGGRMSDPGTGLSPSGVDWTFPSSVTGGGYGCNIMNQVWSAAKCVDAVANTAQDGFYTFANYQASGDRRFLPLACTAIGARWDLNIRESTGINTPWTEDTFLTFVERFNHQLNPAAAATTGCAHITPVPTGLMVYGTEFTPYPEHVCFAPGCYYVPGGGAGPGRCARSNVP